MSFMTYSLADRLLIDEDGEVCEITNMFDAWGEETDDTQAAVVFVARRSDEEWLTVEIDDGVEALVH